VRRQLGEEEYEFPEADMPMIVTATGAVPLKGLVPDELNGPTTPGDSGANGEGPQEGQPQEQEEGGGEPKGGEGGSTPTGVDKAVRDDELRDFATFVKARLKRGNWRAFEFGTFDEESAEKMNERGYFIVKGGAPAPENFFAYFQGEAERLERGENLKGKRSLHNLPHVSRVAGKHREALEAGLGAVTGISAAIASALGGVSAHAAVTSNLTFASADMIATYRAIYEEAGAAASGVASDQFGVDAVSGGLRLQALLAQIPASIKGIEQTTMDRMMTAIQDGVNAGETASQIADRITATVLGPMLNGQATTIAMTEANRAYGAAYLDAATSAGQTEVNWVCEGGNPCPICQDNEDDSPWPIASVPSFPAHPNCLCCFTSTV